MKQFLLISFGTFLGLFIALSVSSVLAQTIELDPIIEDVKSSSTEPFILIKSLDKKVFEKADSETLEVLEKLKAKELELNLLVSKYAKLYDTCRNSK